MAKDDQRRKNFWDEEDEEIESPKKGGAVPGKPASADSDEIDRRIHEARVLMEQTHALYQQFFAGVEKRTPIEKVRLLETKINELQRTSTNITTAKFKVSQFLAQYAQMKDLWERKLREREKK